MERIFSNRSSFDSIEIMIYIYFCNSAKSLYNTNCGEFLMIFNLKLSRQYKILVDLFLLFRLCFSNFMNHESNGKFEELTSLFQLYSIWYDNQ